MKTTLLTRVYALMLSTVFASLATVGVALLMADSGERAQLAASTTVVAAKHQV